MHSVCVNMFQYVHAYLDMWIFRYMAYFGAVEFMCGCVVVRMCRFEYVNAFEVSM